MKCYDQNVIDDCGCLSAVVQEECGCHNDEGDCHCGDSCRSAGPMPRIGERAPRFVAQTTQGTVTFPDDYPGQWKILFSHPADFTPVCTSEFIAFARMQQQFARLNCQLVGLSIDGVNSHVAWLRAIEKINYKGEAGTKVQFPVVDDVSMRVASLYGMIHPGVSSTLAVRAVFFIDPADTIRAIIYYPLQLGRNFAEIRRALVGLQTVDKFGVSLPADWQPGDEVVVPTAPTTVAAEEAERSNGHHCYDWFFCTKPLAKSEVCPLARE